ncbi:MAG TPA: hypothetical protein VN678_09720 [Acidobacteriaceae bacterium]|nr:hypothetical protein [Acidobacteriaceae bacterium]
MKVFTILALSLIAFPITAQQTIRIRFVNGKTGHPLKLKWYEAGTGSAIAGTDYTVDKVDGNSILVTFRNVTTFRFRAAEFDPCDVPNKRTSPPQYSVQAIEDHGFVSPNFCGNFHASPVVDELIIYSRHEHWWEVSRDVLKGLLICG